MMLVGLTIGCAAVDVHFDEQERRLKEKYLKNRLRDWYQQRETGRRGCTRSGQSAQREPHGRWPV